MDALDSLLLESWNRIGKACREDRLRARTRRRRRFMGVLTRPDRIVVIAVLHGHRHSRRWRRRGE